MSLPERGHLRFQRARSEATNQLEENMGASKQGFDSMHRSRALPSSVTAKLPVVCVCAEHEESWDQPRTKVVKYCNLGLETTILEQSGRFHFTLGFA